jgi:ComF family protein
VQLTDQQRIALKEKLGEEMGIWYGEDLKEIEYIKKIDFIIPVPLHLKKLKKRGYNQSESFAKGLSMSLKIPILSTNIQRVNSSDSQTTKSRWDRWESIEKAFEITDREIIRGKNVLLVDDVITTGSTLSACATVVQPYVNETSIAGLALAC